MRWVKYGWVKKMISKTESTGFTLIEVMIALAIFAVAVASLSTAMHGNVRNANYLKEKTIANWIANNKLVEIHAANTYPPLQDRSDKIEYAGTEWVVNTKVQKAQTKMPIRIVEVSVGIENADDEVDYFSTLTAIVSDTQ
ncbi:MAG: type II secretion system protein GspI [Pseudomonadales bacterium]|jgi:general secretion pathway protein I|nr:type II secretion system protein GspI [Pseudomonadales bacterium]RLT90116.1 MAG: type II secretion system protein GspI [Ketobacter sp. GenoA1]RLT99127.1 MAG: type II secretion system protein GspI [Ketobacter sp.]TNC90975.1 MAG: type II secretion system protein GspI [Alcanivorax sp.]HAG93738.1 type II secretion system protein GspI [Gammaproteobacteria bacterium]